MLDQILEEIDLSDKQYGGRKQCGTEHFIIEAWEKILYTLEDNKSSVNLVSLDYAKAFNRMSHQRCLQAFAQKGVSGHTVRFIASFLVGRQMCVRLDGTTFKTRPIPGGSPQGCVSANVLFCVAIEGLDEGEYESDDEEHNRAVNESKETSSLFPGDTFL